MKLKLSNVRKVSPISKFEVNKSYPKGRHKPLVPNSFGLPAGPKGSCRPGYTVFCMDCYAADLERAFPSAKRLVQHNFALLKTCGSNTKKMAQLLGTLIDDYRVAHAKAEQKLRKETGDPTLTIGKAFRIHWDGDFYSKAYAAAWRIIILSNPDIQFWAYTRSFSYVGILADIENLVLYLSVDQFNIAEAKACQGSNPWVKLAFCGKTWDETEKVAMEFPDARKGPRCPALTKKMPMVNTDGVGACITCGLCIKGVNSVRFAAKH